MPSHHPELNQRASKIQLVILDVDGVLTDGRIHLGTGAEEGRTFYVRDGLAIKIGQLVGLQFGILSGRESPVVSRRASELGIEHVHQGVIEKGERFDQIVSETGIPPEQICFVGDDLIDLPAMRRAGFAASPADADSEVVKHAHYICQKNGGHGAVREVIEVILRASDRWERALERFLR